MSLICYVLLNGDVARQRLCGAFSGAQALGTSGADVIAGLAVSIHEAKRVRDMRKYPFWARGADALKRCSSPRPERYCAIARPEGTRPKKIAAERNATEAGVYGSKFFSTLSVRWSLE